MINSISSNFKAIGFMIIFCFCSPFSDAIVRVLSEMGFQPGQVMFVRSIVSVLLLLPYIIKNKEYKIPKNLWKWYALRSTFFFIAIFSWLSVLGKIPLPQMYAIGFTSPVLASLISIIWLKESLTRKKILGLIGGFIGVLIVIRPGFSDLSIYNFVPLFCSFNWASAMVISKKLSSNQSPYQMTVILSGSCILFASIPTAFQWITPTIDQWGILIGLGCLVVMIHTFLIRAYKLADLSTLAPFEFMNLVFASCIGWVMFDELIDTWTLFGGIIIFSSALLSTLSKSTQINLNYIRSNAKR